MNTMQALGSWDFTLANYDSVWSGLIQAGLLLIALLLGNILRNVIPAFKKGLIPSALIGGTLLLLLEIFCNKLGFNLIDNRTMQVITYHGLGIGFAAMSLKSEKTNGKTIKSQIVEFGALQGGTYMLQAFAGLLITILFFIFTKNGDNPISYIGGLLLPLAYGQGPGNALTWDVNFTNMAQTGFSGYGSVGLSLASIGFIVASVIGVLYINIMRKKGLITIRRYDSSLDNINHLNPTGNEIPDNESVDKFSIQVGFVALVYMVSFAFMCLLAAISDFTNSIAWGFNFLWAAIAAMGIRAIVKILRNKNVLKRDYINNYQMDRISGFAFDLMIVAGVAAIEINNIMNYILPIIVLSVVGAIITHIYIKKVSEECFEGFHHEFYLMCFGTLTGTASNGMILLKEIDPNLKTPTSNLYILSTFPAMVMIAPLLLMLKFAASSFTNACICCIIFFALWAIYSIYLFRRRIFKRKYKDTPKNIWIEE